MYDQATIGFLQKQFEKAWEVGPSDGYNLTGICHDCKKWIELKVDVDNETGKFTVSGGGLKYFPQLEKPLFKCDDCLAESIQFTNYQPCEVFTRVCGYLRPIRQFNPGKKAEFYDRVNYVIKEEDCE